MAEIGPLDVVLCWHMHQPQYRRAEDGRYQLPWTYLHALKDYTDMAWHLEQTPGAAAVVNFTPILLDQLDDYGRQFETRDFRDPLLQALAVPERVGRAEKPALAEAFFRANAQRMIERFPPYAKLRAAYEAAAGGEFFQYLSDAYFADLAVWYHLAWLGESIRRTDERVRRLLERGEDFTPEDRATLLDVVGDAVRGIIPRYRSLAEAGRIELSTSPYAHPIVPLLIDFNAARESTPDAPLPDASAYPHGMERAQEHTRAAIESHRKHFGSPPQGCWPPEGGVSDAAARLFAASGFRWTATCESVLLRSLQGRPGGLSPRSDYLYKPYVLGPAGTEIPCFFRNVHLSDLIGFRYADWHADDAVGNLLSELHEIANGTRSETAPVVSIILDGENAWEHYPENGFYFLSGLYRALGASTDFRLTTFSEYLARHRPQVRLEHVVAGSWVYGTFSTWIGDTDKNRAWNLLVQAKTDYDRLVINGMLRGSALAAAEAQLKVCEGSDWFWWFGDYNPAQTVSDFDRLFRNHVRDLYCIMGIAPPAHIDTVIGTGSGAPVHGGTMRENPVA